MHTKNRNPRRDQITDKKPEPRQRYVVGQIIRRDGMLIEDYENMLATKARELEEDRNMISAQARNLVDYATTLNDLEQAFELCDVARHLLIEGDFNKHVRINLNKRIRKKLPSYKFPDEISSERRQQRLAALNESPLHKWSGILFAFS